MYFYNTFIDITLKRQCHWHSIEANMPHICEWPSFVKSCSVSIERRETTAKVITLGNHNRCKQYSKQIRTLGKHK